MYTDIKIKYHQVIFAMVKIKIIRHSERLDYKYPFYWIFCVGHYWSDAPLTNNGHKIARLKGTKIKNNSFNPKHIYTSPYTRTMATSTEIRSSFPQSEIVIEPLLAEYQPTYKHKVNLYPEGIPTTYEDQETNFNYPETYENFKERVLFIITKLLERHDDDLIIITHGEVLKVYINFIQEMYPDLMIDPGSTPYLTTLSFEFDKTNDKFIEDSIRLE
jgi:broad specificity phosphatase PhoE